MQKTIVDPPNVVPLQRPPSRAPAPARAAPSSKLWWAGWVAAAACLMLVAGTWRMTHPPGVPLANERARLMSEAGSLQAVFAATKDPAATQAQGDVVWSQTEQRGFMRFRGLAQNDRAAWQYQLWIFDKEQDDRYPIDGGVFDVQVTPDGDVLVPITAKIKVTKATAFVVTIEKPGGVVVSKRERVVMAAKI
jgi:hypothetical protein